MALCGAAGVLAAPGEGGKDGGMTGGMKGGRETADLFLYVLETNE